MVAITSIYAGLIALLYVYLSFWVVGARIKTRTSLGDGGHEIVLKRMRVHANCAEYAPLGLILLGLAELQGLGALWLHGAGAALLAGRLLHAWGFGANPQVIKARQLGMFLTLTMIGALALANLWFGLQGGMG